MGNVMKNIKDSQLIDSNIHSLGDFIEQSFAKYGDNPAFHCLGQTLSFREIDQQSRNLACWLQQESGLVAGDRIIIQLPNLNQYPIAAYAALRAGLVLVNTNPLYTPREMLHQFKDSGAKGIIILADILPKLNEIIGDTAIETVIVTRSDDLLTKNLAASEQGISFNQAISIGQSLTLQPRPETKLDDVCILQYTGGTTGVSKGACLTHRNILSNASQTLGRIKNRCNEGEETFVCPLPLYHIYAFTVNMMIFFSRGNFNILIPNPRDIDGFIATIKPFKFTGFAGINTLFVGLCHHPEFKQLDFSKFKLTISGGSALTFAAVKIWREVTGCSITEGYGLSETSPVVSMNEPGNEQVGSIGKPVLETEIEIWDDNDQVVADGEEGQLVVRGPQVMAGYWNMPDETSLVMTRGFFKTGDIATRRPNGCFKIVDRLKDMIIVSGFNVYPNEIEEVLASHPAVLEAAVVGEPDDHCGERVCAYITVEGEFDVEQLQAYCREQLTGYKVPKKIEVLEALPKSTVGKILRRELRKA